MIRDLFAIFLVLAATAVVVVLLAEVVPPINRPTDPRIAACEARGGAWLHRERACVAGPALKAPT